MALWLVMPAAAARPNAATDHAVFDRYVDDTIQHYHLPGIAVSVVQGGKIVYTRTAGELVIGSGRKVEARLVDARKA